MNNKNNNINLIIALLRSVLPDLNTRPAFLFLLIAYCFLLLAIAYCLLLVAYCLLLIAVVRRTHLLATLGAVRRSY
jgi:hypothetical protein